jgi:hypothetical protein
VVFDEGPGVAEGIKSLHGAFLLVFMAFGTVYLLPDSQCFRVRSGETGDGFHLGAGGDYAK